MSFIQYAAYGSNLHPVRLAERVPSAQLLGTGILEAWSLHFHKRSNVDGSGKCSISNSGLGNGVRVAVFRMRPQEKRILDEIEGLGEGYDEISVVVPGHGDCFTYTASLSHILEELEPMDWYREIVLLGCKYHDFPSEYVDAIQALGARRDLDQARSEEQWALVDRLNQL